MSDISMLRESLSLSPQNDIVITQENVTNLLKRVNIRKTAQTLFVDALCAIVLTSSVECLHHLS